MNRFCCWQTFSKDDFSSVANFLCYNQFFCFFFFLFYGNRATNFSIIQRIFGIFFSISPPMLTYTQFICLLLFSFYILCSIVNNILLDSVSHVIWCYIVLYTHCQISYLQMPILLHAMKQSTHYSIASIPVSNWIYTHVHK